MQRAKILINGKGRTGSIKRAARIPQSAQPQKGVAKKLVEHLPTFSLMFSGMIYATGFLIIFIFHDGYRLRGIDSEFFKAKFFHVGIMFTALLLNVVLPVGSTLAYFRYRNSQPKWVINPLGISAFSLMALNFLVVLFFAPPGMFRHWSIQVGLLTAILVPVGLGLYFKRMRLRGQPIPGRTRIVVFVNLALVMSLVCILNPFYPNLVPMIWPAGLWFVLFGILLSLVGFLLVTLGDETRERHEQRTRMLFCAAVFGMLYFLEINVFALGIYHYIPAAKGGGDFSEGRVVLRIEKESAMVLPPDLIAARRGSVFVTRPLVLIETTATAVFVADPATNGGPVMWREGMRRRPSVFEISRDGKVAIEYRQNRL